MAPGVCLACSFHLIFSFSFFSFVDAGTFVGETFFSNYFVVTLTTLHIQCCYKHGVVHSEGRVGDCPGYMYMYFCLLVQLLSPIQAGPSRNHVSSPNFLVNQ